MIKAVIFDLDNTLIDFNGYKRICCGKAIDAMISAGLKVKKEKAAGMIRQLYRKHGIEDKTIFQKFLRKVEGSVDYRKLTYAINAYRQARIGLLAPYPGVRKTLIELRKKGLRLAVVSDAPKLKAWLRLTAMKIDDLFDIVVTLEDTGRKKPSRLPFRAVLKKLNKKPSECLMVGDNPRRDIKGARKLGMKTCFASYGHEGETKVKADYIIKNINELVKIF